MTSKFRIASAAAAILALASVQAGAQTIGTSLSNVDSVSPIIPSMVGPSLTGAAAAATGGAGSTTTTSTVGTTNG
ncbi:hypothetical protein [Marinibacterium profundimaris]|uniref:hypothetical protein n=1 Tax=Marinibacterium profundimaris TaxID=1679460 RepID=UPI001181481A|nr:hypothetical protein [Marinibacterium profundimaris]